MQTVTTVSDMNVCTGDDFVINHAGAGGLLFDAARGKYQSDIQNRIWLLAVMLEERKTTLPVREVITGVNNLLITFDPLRLTPLQAEEELIRHWNQTRGETLTGRDVSLPVVYGGEARTDLAQMSVDTGLSIERIIELHSAAVYTVACLGSMPGFAYMTGLPPELARPRLSSPRMGIPKGSVIIGGEQTGVMPCTAPSGWHLLGSTTADNEMSPFTYYLFLSARTLSILTRYRNTFQIIGLVCAVVIVVTPKSARISIFHKIVSRSFIIIVFALFADKTRIASCYYPGRTVTLWTQQ